MASWHVLEPSELPAASTPPQLLIKTVFRKDSYVVHLTCLSNIWSEELDFEGIVDRASKEQCPIEVNKQDATQLAILLGNVEKSLTNAEDTTCRLSRSGDNAITLHTSVALPAPLDGLTWKFELKKRTSTTLKNELILPLLLSSHIQHERINTLIATINEKDKAITRLVDQFESSSLDLAAAFPILSSLKSGRRSVKREQAAKHVPALRPFKVDIFKDETAALRESEADVTTFGLFQEALSECTPSVPSELQSRDGAASWWTDLPVQLGPIKAIPKLSLNKSAATAKSEAVSDASSEDETEDEFETHNNFKTRNIVPKTATTKATLPQHTPRVTEKQDGSENDQTGDDDDLDAPPRSASQKAQVSWARSPVLDASSSPAKEVRAKKQGFRIGGKAKLASTRSPSLEEANTPPESLQLPTRQPPSSPPAAMDTTPKKAKRVFKIGGKGKHPDAGSSQQADIEPLQVQTKAAKSPTEPPSSPPVVRPITKEATPIKDEYIEETAEQKAERRRAELKRKTDEAAKKQMQQKKKRRF